MSFPVPAMSRMRAASFLLLLHCLILTACNTKEYKIELRPQGAVMQRAVTMPVSSEQFDLIAARYGLEPTAEQLASFEESRIADQTLSSEFGNTMPDDIGGQGFFLHYVSPFGSSSTYTESFRGNSDLAGMLELRKLAFDRLCSVLLLVLDQALAETEDYARFRQFVDTELRHDLWNIILLASSTDTIGRTLSPTVWGFDESFAWPFSIRTLHYLIERGYVDGSKLQDTMPLLTALDTNDLDSARQLLEVVTRSIARVMAGQDVAELPAPLARLTESIFSGDLERSWDALLQNNEQLPAMIAAWNDEPSDSEPYVLKDSQFLDRLGEQSLGFKIFSFGFSGNVLKVELHLPVQPYQSNGIQDDGGVMIWSQALASPRLEDSDLPNLVYAFWSEPDTAYQLQHLGTIAFADEDLADFCLWYLALPEAKQGEWDAFVDSLTPDGDLMNRLREFGFSDETGPVKPDDVRSRIARMPLRTMIRAIEELVEESE